MAPEKLLETLKAKSNSRKQRSLGVVYEVCQEQAKAGSRGFSIATIGRLSAEQNGPSPQTIRNKGGIDFRELITTWAKYADGATKKPPKLPESGIYSILEKIEDPAVRSIVGTILAKNTKLQGEVNLLKRQKEIVIDRRTVPLEPAPNDADHQAILLNHLTLTEKSAMQHAISDELMEQEGWSIEPSGRVVNSLGRTIFKAGYATALQKIISTVI
jgi:hypothetical protein